MDVSFFRKGQVNYWIDKTRTKLCFIKLCNFATNTTNMVNKIHTRTVRKIRTCFQHKCKEFLSH